MLQFHMGMNAVCVNLGSGGVSVFSLWPTAAFTVLKGMFILAYAFHIGDRKNH